MAAELLIGELAGQFGLSPQAIRYYERLGLIDQPKRNRSGYRLYSAEASERLKLIRSAQNFGLSLQDIKQLLELDATSSNCETTFKQMVQKHLQDIEQQLKELTTTHQTLSQQFQQLQILITDEPSTLSIDTPHSLQKLMDQITANMNWSNKQQPLDIAKDLLKYYSAGERNFQGMKLIGAKLNGAILSGANFSRAELMLASLNEVSMENTILRRAFLSGADLVGAYLKQAELTGATLIGTDLSEANLTDASLVSSNLGGACLREANLSGTNLSEAVLIGADLRGANLTGANLLGCNLYDAKLDSILGVPHTIVNNHSVTIKG